MRKIKKLRRPKQGRKLLGVCAAIGNLFGIDAIFVRMVFPPVSTLTAIAVYILLAYAIPEEKDYIDV